jgi:quercetin dioxygenase-like cupin family protein
MSSLNLRRRTHAPLLALGLVAIFAGTAFATIATGFHSAIQARGTVGETVHYNTGDIKFQTKAAIDVVTATVDIDPLASSGWHSHPGVVLVTVAAGSVTFYDEHCVATVHASGTSFLESGDAPGLVRNESSTVAVKVFATYVVPAGTPNAGLRVDAANPGCAQS